MTPDTVDVPRVNQRFVDPQTGYLTQYGFALLSGLRNRTGGSDGINIRDLEIYIDQQLQDDREAPVPNLLDPPAPPDDQPALLSIPAQQEDNPGIGLLIAYIQRLESRIQELEESR